MRFVRHCGAAVTDGRFVLVSTGQPIDHKARQAFLLHESDLQASPPRRADTSSNAMPVVKSTNPGPIDDIDQLLEFEAEMTNDGVPEVEPIEIDSPPPAAAEFDDDDTADLSQLDDGDLFGDLEQLQKSENFATGNQTAFTNKNTTTKLSRSQVIDLSATDVEESLPRKSAKTEDKQLANRASPQDD